jgi:hypothetical protein
MLTNLSQLILQWPMNLLERTNIPPVASFAEFLRREKSSFYYSNNN